MHITQDELIALPSREFNQLMSNVDPDTQDLLYLLLNDLLLDGYVEVSDDIAPSSMFE